MDIQAERDLIKDDYGNYYLATNVTGTSITVVNAAVYYSYNQMLNEDFLAEIKRIYPNEVAVGKYFTDQVARHIEELENSIQPGSIYHIDEVKEKYDLHVKPIYDDSFNI